MWLMYLDFVLVSRVVIDRAGHLGHRENTFLHSFMSMLTTGIFLTVFRIRIRTDPHKEMPPGSGSGSAWTDADPDTDPGGKKV